MLPVQVILFNGELEEARIKERIILRGGLESLRRKVYDYIIDDFVGGESPDVCYLNFYWDVKHFTELMMSNGNLPFNMDTVMEQCGGSATVVGMVLDEFLTQVPTDTAEMEAGIAGGDLLSASKAAHRLKGTAGVLGAAKLHPLCAQMELVCKEGKADEAATVYAELKAEAQLCVDAVPAAKTMLG